MFATVAIPVPLGQAFSYAVPLGLRSQISVGGRVLCEFGRRKVVGVVLELSHEAPAGLAPERIKAVLAVADSTPALPEELLRFLRELSAYYLAPIGEVLCLALPQLERGKLANVEQELFEAADVGLVGKLVQVLVPNPEAATSAVAGLRGQARAVWDALQRQGASSIAELEQAHSNARGAAKRLSELGLVTIEKQARAVDPFFDQPVARDEPKALNAHQAAAVSAIRTAIETQRTENFLLQGVTGSGKTEVYLHGVAECLERGGGAIVLVPEIALTPQLVGRFRARFGEQVAVLHSGLGGPQRAQMWRSLRDNTLRVAIGARSALFAPVRDLRLICVDEEHDPSFKQEEGVRYNARDMALLRAHRASAVCVLGSATPGLSSELLVRQGKLKLLELPERAVPGARLPQVEVLNLRTQGPGPTGHRLLSAPLHSEIRRVLDERRQVILFLNRRGFAPSLICESCGTVCECPNCSVALTVHRNRGEHVRCHYCDFTASSLPECGQCHSRRLSLEGAGTERIEQALQEAFPKARVARLDRDVASGLKSEAVLDRVRSGEVDILVGTQMVTKGHDIPNVALVGVLNADAALAIPDYQASERTFSLIVQVAGRAGRGEVPGKVLIQTRNPEHIAIRLAARQDRAAFVEAELGERRDARYPPYYRLLLVRLDAADVGLVQREAERLTQLARRCVGDSAEVMGPSPAPIERVRNRFRYRLIVRSKQRAPLHRAAHALMATKLDRRVRIVFDIDPVNML